MQLFKSVPRVHDASIDTEIIKDDEHNYKSDCNTIQNTAKTSDLTSQINKNKDNIISTRR